MEDATLTKNAGENTMQNAICRIHIYIIHSLIYCLQQLSVHTIANIGVSSFELMVEVPCDSLFTYGQVVGEYV